MYTVTKTPGVKGKHEVKKGNELLFVITRRRANEFQVFRPTGELDRPETFPTVLAAFDSVRDTLKEAV